MNVADKKINTAAIKAPINLVPLASIVGPSRVAEHGSIKYALGNWHQADDDDIAGRYMGGLLRHVIAAQRLDGYFDLASIAKLDDESGLPEIDHAIMGLLMLRGLAIKHGVLPVDPGQSKFVQAASARKPTPEIIVRLPVVGNRVRVLACGHAPDTEGGTGVIARVGTGNLPYYIVLDEPSSTHGAGVWTGAIEVVS